MGKTEKILLILLLILALIFLLGRAQITGDEFLSKYSYTKAICPSSGYCEDYYIECDGKNLIGLTPTGFSIQTKNAKENTNESFCD